MNCSGRTYRFAFTAGCTVGAIEYMPPVFNTMIRTRHGAGATLRAFHFVKGQFRSRGYPFGIVTPAAREGAALEKQGGANSRTIVHRKSFYPDIRCHSGVSLLCRVHGIHPFSALYYSIKSEHMEWQIKAKSWHFVIDAGLVTGYIIRCSQPGWLFLI